MADPRQLVEVAASQAVEMGSHLDEAGSAAGLDCHPDYRPCPFPLDERSRLVVPGS